MSKIYCWFAFLCFIANSVALPTTKGPFGQWPSLITTAPRCPSVPPLKDLKENLQEIARERFKSCDLRLLNKLAEQNLDLNDEDINNVTEIEEVKSEENATVVNESNTKDKTQFIPTFIPIFRPRFVPKADDLKTSNAISDNVKENKNTVVEIVTNGTKNPFVKITETKDFTKENNVEATPRQVVIVNSVPPNAIPFHDFPIEVLRATKPSDDVPYNVGSFNPESVNVNPVNAYPENLLPVNVLPTNTLRTDVISSPPPINPALIYPTNAIASEGNNLNPIPFNSAGSVPLNAIPVQYFPSDVNSAKPCPLNVLPANSIPSNIAKVDPTIFTTNSIQLNSVPSNKCQQQCTVPSGLPSQDACPVNSIPSNSISVNTSSINCPANAICSNSIHPNLIPSNSVPTQSCRIDCKEMSKPCTDGTQNGNLVFFKPETVSFMNFEGDLVKKTTMTILVPTHLSKLNL